MTNFWLKLRLWTKVVVFSLIAAYVLLFVYYNWSLRVSGSLNFVFVAFDHPRILFVLLFTAMVSIIAWWLLGVVFTTIRQFRELHERSRIERLEREIMDRQAKADKLQTRDSAPPASEPRPAAEPPKT